MNSKVPPMYQLCQIEDVLKRSGITYDKDEVIGADGTVDGVMFWCFNTDGRPVIEFTAERYWRGWFCSGYRLSVDDMFNGHALVNLRITDVLRMYQEVEEAMDM